MQMIKEDLFIWKYLFHFLVYVELWFASFLIDESTDTFYP